MFMSVAQFLFTYAFVCTWTNFQRQNEVENLSFNNPYTYKLFVLIVIFYKYVLISSLIQLM